MDPARHFFNRKEGESEYTLDFGQLRLVLDTIGLFTFWN